MTENSKKNCGKFRKNIETKEKFPWKKEKKNLKIDKLLPSIDTSARHKIHPKRSRAEPTNFAVLKTNFHACLNEKALEMRWVVEKVARSKCSWRKKFYSTTFYSSCSHKVQDGGVDWGVCGWKVQPTGCCFHLNDKTSTSSSLHKVYWKKKLDRNVKKTFINVQVHVEAESPPDNYDEISVFCSTQIQVPVNQPLESRSNSKS